ncbi:hypothetical protein KIN_23650 [Litoreibacter roseus]|uniref:Uncharacterized protein n=1 Tax=Litoreibacter roseus TaxID=2601869 RepID=A0A6N6JG18_9RHOB|nr:hypothetical protein KIN_23650 [Litoreibacter roseus]
MSPVAMPSRFKTEFAAKAIIVRAVSNNSFIMEDKNVQMAKEVSSCTTHPKEKGRAGWHALS